MKRKSPLGTTTSELVHSAHVAGNADVFPEILELHVPEGSTVADVTFGKGVFWRHVPEGKYNLMATDIQSGVDCRDLPYEDETIDCVVPDPPYMEGLYRKDSSNLAGASSYSAFRAHYSDGKAKSEGLSITRQCWTCTSRPVRKRIGFSS